MTASMKNQKHINGLILTKTKALPFIIYVSILHIPMMMRKTKIISGFLPTNIFGISKVLSIPDYLAEQKHFGKNLEKTKLMRY